MPEEYLQMSENLYIKHLGLLSVWNFSTKSAKPAKLNSEPDADALRRAQELSAKQNELAAEQQRRNGNDLLPLKPPYPLSALLPKQNVVYKRVLKGASGDRALDQRNTCNLRKLLKLNPNLDRPRGTKKSARSPRGKKKQPPANDKFKPFVIEPYYTKKSRDDKTLLFQSRFESGNLDVAVKVSEQEYNLILQDDVNTNGYTQWYFFRVQNTTANLPVKFNIINFQKGDSLYNHGMKPLVYSLKHEKKTQEGWMRAGENIVYFDNGLKKDRTKKSLSTLTFTYTFEFSEDQVYFAYSFPYTFSHMQEVLKAAEAKKVVKRATLCTTIAGNQCDVLTITNAGGVPRKRGVVFTARVHPGESVGSWMMQGVIDFLTDLKNPEAHILRDHFVFKVVPMLNPDGVINGNYRCSLAGCDLNRRWDKPSLTLHPTIHHTKKLIKQFASERELLLFVDFHGHSNKKDVFIYGCHKPDDPMETRMFPFLMAKLCPYFSFNKSRFGNQKSKETTARISLFKELDLPTIYTMEASFCGNQEGPYAGLHFTVDALMTVGRDCCRSILSFCDIPVPPTPEPLTIQEEAESGEQSPIMRMSSPPPLSICTSQAHVKQVFESELKEILTRRGLDDPAGGGGELSSAVESDDSDGSDASPSDDNFDLEEQAELMPIERSPVKNHARRKYSELRQPTRLESTPPSKILDASPQKSVNGGGGKFQSSFAVINGCSRREALKAPLATPKLPGSSGGQGGSTAPCTGSKQLSYQPSRSPGLGGGHGGKGCSPLKEEQKRWQQNATALDFFSSVDNVDFAYRSSGPAPPAAAHAPPIASSSRQAQEAQIAYPLPYSEGGKGLTRNISPLFGSRHLHHAGSPEFRPDREGDVVELSYSPFGEPPPPLFNGNATAFRNYKLEKDSQQFLRNLTTYSKRNSQSLNGAAANGVRALVPYLSTKRSPEKLKVVGKQSFSTVENSFDASAIISQFQAQHARTAGEEEVQLPFISNRKSVCSNSSSDATERAPPMLAAGRRKLFETSLQEATASASQFPAPFVVGQKYSLSSTAFAGKLKAAGLSALHHHHHHHSPQKRFYGANPRAKYHAAAKRNLKQWLTDQNYVKNIVLKELRSKGQPLPIFNSSSVRYTKRQPPPHKQEFKVMVGVAAAAASGAMPPIRGDSSRQKRAAAAAAAGGQGARTLYQHFPFDA